MIYVVLALVAIIGILIWSIKRKAREREAAGAERMKAMMDAMQAGKAQGTPAAPQAIVQAATPVATSPSTGLAEFVSRVSLLDATQMEWYDALRAALPLHTVIPRASLASFARVGDAISGFEREARERRLSSATVDFLVCDEALQPLAAVCLSEPQEFTRSTCERIKLRLVVPEGRDNLSGQILGSSR